MDDFQRREAIEMLIAQTDVDEEEIEEYDDFGFEAWLNELGYEWNPKGGYGMARGNWWRIDAVKLTSLPEPDGTPQNGGGAAWVVVLLLAVVAIAAIVAMAGAG